MSRDSGYRRGGRTLGLALALVLFLAVQTRAEHSGGALVRFDFDRETVETGPYTLMVFENSRGTVELTDAYRYSGHRSVEIRDVAGDGDFAELQGYFPQEEGGTLQLRFALMIAEPMERLNVAFAGPAHFVLRPGGIGFWIKTEAGQLYEVSGGEDRFLFEPQAFVWYVFDVAYSIDEGTYDLEVREERASQPFFESRGTPNASGHPGPLRLFSFIGDLPGRDGSNAHFFVDDIEVTSARTVDRRGFVAPGRRLLFVDIWDRYAREMATRPGCPPSLGLEDFGLSPRDLSHLESAGLLARVQRLVQGEAVPDRTGPRSPIVEGIELWRRGCTATEACDADCRSELLERSASALPGSRLPSISRVLALAEAGRWHEADALFVAIYPDWTSDPRLPAISAMLGLARGDLAGAEDALVGISEDAPGDRDDPLLRQLWSGRLDRRLIERLKDVHGPRWSTFVEAALAVEHRYYVLLWQERYAEAESYAGRKAEESRLLDLPEARWVERQGDARFYSGDFTGALESYGSILATAGNPTSVLLKLSDVHFKLGDAELERAYREKIYGSLDSGTSILHRIPDLEFDPCECSHAN